MAFNAVPTRMLITIQRPHWWLAGILGILVLFLFLIWLAYEYGLSQGGFDRAQSIAIVDELQQQLVDAQAQIAEKQRQAAMLERNNRIDDGASQQLKQSLNEAQAEVLELKKELSFYKSIVSPEQTKRSVAIQTIKLKDNARGGYDYKIMVSQRGQNDRFVRGSIDVTIEGDQQGQARTVKLASISDEAKQQTRFGFRYFQNFEGSLTLPQAFRPETMRVVVKPRSSRIDAIDEQFAWADLTAGGAEEHVGQQ